MSVLKLSVSAGGIVSVGTCSSPVFSTPRFCGRLGIRKQLIVGGTASQFLNIKKGFFHSNEASSVLCNFISVLDASKMILMRRRTKL